MIKEIEDFFSFCNKKGIVFSPPPLGEKQIKIFWEFIFNKQFKNEYFVDIRNHTEYNKVNIFINNYTKVREKFNTFLIFCKFSNIKFQRNTIKGEKDFVRIWYSFFEETISITQANYYMKIIKDKELWLSYDEILEEEYYKVAYYCVLNNLFVDKRSSLILQRNIIDIWYILFKKHVKTYDPYISNKNEYVADFEKNSMVSIYKSVNMYMIVKIYKDIKKKINNQRLEIFNYFKKNNIDFTNVNIGIDSILHYWNFLFSEKINNHEAFSHFQAIIKEHTLNSTERFAVFKFINDNNIKFKENRSEQIKDLANILKKLFKYQYFNNQKLNNILSDLYINFPEVFGANKVIKDYNDVKYYRIKNYCEDNNILFSSTNEIAIEQLTLIYKELYLINIDKDEALILINYLKKYFSNIFRNKTKLTKIPYLNNLDKVEEDMKDELLIIFAEYCKKKQIYFVKNEDKEYLNRVWNMCFGI